MLLTNNVFNSNQAYSEGGAIKWIEVEPVIPKSNIFYNNSALYGPINAAFPFRIELEYNLFSINVCLNGSLTYCYPQISDLSSGSALNISLFFTIKDKYNVTVTSLNSG